MTGNRNVSRNKMWSKMHTNTQSLRIYIGSLRCRTMERLTVFCCVSQDWDNIFRYTRHCVVHRGFPDGLNRETKVFHSMKPSYHMCASNESKQHMCCGQPHGRKLNTFSISVGKMSSTERKWKFPGIRSQIPRPKFYL